MEHRHDAAVRVGPVDGAFSKEATHAMGTPRHTFFIAHAGADKARALELHRLLHPGVSTFLDAVDLIPGDDWPRVLARALQASRATVALVSDQSDSAYYLSEEIHTAIAYQRADPDRHRLIPVFLDGRPSDPTLIPYGLRVKHALDARELGLAGVAAELRRTAALLEGTPTLSVPVPAPASVDRNQLFDALCALLPAQFEEILFRLSVPVHYLPPQVVARAERAISLIQWAEAQGPATLEGLVAATRRHMPGRMT